MMGHGDGTPANGDGAAFRGGVLRFVLDGPEARPRPVDGATAVDGTGARIAQLADGVHVDDRGPVLAARLAALHDGRSTRITYRVPAADGSVRWLLEELDAHDVDGTTTVTGVAVDVTAEHAAFAVIDASLTSLHRELETFRRRERATGTFVRLLLHDLRAWLHDGRSVLDAAGPSDGTPGATHRLRRCFEELEALTVGVLEIEHLDEAAELRRTALDLAVVAERAVARIEDPRVSSDLHPARSTGDAFLLERVVENLVRNAIVHTPTGTRVRVRTWADAAGAVVEVADDGPGIPTSMHDHVFEPFVRLDGSCGPGIGMGLALVSRVVALHDGRCSLRETPGGGTTVRVELPPAPHDGPTPAPGHNGRVHQSARRQGSVVPSLTDSARTPLA